MIEYQLAGAYLKGLFDGEGSVSLRGRRLRSIRIGNTDESILDYAVSQLQILGIESRVYWGKPDKRFAHAKPCGTIQILGRRNIILFCRYINSSSKIKQEKLRELRYSYRPGFRYLRYRFHRYKSPTFHKQVLNLYAQGLSSRDVGHKLKCTAETVRRVLKLENYPIRHYTPRELGLASVAKRRTQRLSLFP